MLVPLTQSSQFPDFIKACSYERIFGSKILVALKAYGLEDPRARFWTLVQDGIPTAALYLSASVLVISASKNADPVPISELIQREKIHETDTNWEQCAQIQSMLGGTTDSSYYMVYQGNSITDEFSDIVPGNLEAVFDVLQRSHEYYRTHLKFDTWSRDLRQKLDRNLMELYQLEVDGKTIGTGCIVSEDDTCGVIAAVAVVPEYRHRGFGSRLSRFLSKRIMEKGKTPCLISGYDEVAELYKQIGFVSVGRWGELYL